MKDWSGFFFSKWFQAAANLVVSAMLIGGTFLQEYGFWRDMSMYCAGTLAGYALMALLQPTLNAKWRAEMEAEIGIMTAAVFARILRESAGIEPEMVVPSRFQSPPTSPLN